MPRETRKKLVVHPCRFRSVLIVQGHDRVEGGPPIAMHRDDTLMHLCKMLCTELVHV